MSKKKTYWRVDLDGEHYGVYESVDGVVDVIREHLNGMTSTDDDPEIHVARKLMTKEEYEALPEL